jgi:hypothetical protein
VKTSSCKAKGRRACQEVQELLYKYAPLLRPGDIEVTSSGATGEDLKLSPTARETYPLVIEVKNTETLNIWKALKQSEDHLAKKSDVDQSLHSPVLFFRRNRSKLYAAIEAETLIQFLRQR